MAEAYRVATMRTLRLAFLSALVLELVATVSVALVAVPVGLRLLDGKLTLPPRWSCCCSPRRRTCRCGRSAPSSTPAEEGLAALGGDLQGPRRRRRSAGTRRASPARIRDFAGLAFDRVEVRYGDVVALRDLTLRRRARRPGRAGRAQRRRQEHDARPGARLRRAERRPGPRRRRRPRRPWTSPRGGPGSRGCRSGRTCSPATVADNIRLGAPGIPPTGSSRPRSPPTRDGFIRGAARRVRHRLGERGHRSCPAGSGSGSPWPDLRAYLRTGAGLLLLDEPTARLDPASEAAVIAGAERLAAGRTALARGARPALLSIVDRVVEVDGTVRERVLR